MKTYFIRHKAKHEDEEEKRKTNLNRIKSLYQSNSIGLFYDNESWDIIKENKFWETHKDNGKDKYYQSYKSCMNFFKKISEEGGQIFCEYEGIDLSNKTKGCFLGIIPPGTPIKKCEELNVSLKLTNIIEVSYSEFPVLLAIRPPYGTMCEPKRDTYSLIANSLRKKKPLTPSRDLIHPSVAEQMCVEYLRIFGLENDNYEKLDYLFLNVGKTMATIDIAGRLTNSGKKFYAQVKNGEISQNSIDDFLKIIEPNDVGIIFSSNKPTDVHENIHYINIDDVFNKLLTNNSQMILDMIGIDLKKIA